MLTLLIILLGCNITAILYDRIHTALTISAAYPNAQIDWFLSGGIKDPFRDVTSEAKKMQKIISEDANVEWVLSPMELQDSTYWEKIHIKNVEQDVEMAFQKYYYIM